MTDDNDLIRRADALALLGRKLSEDHPELADELRDRIAALPAVTVGVRKLVWKQEADNAWVAAHYAIHQYWPHNNGIFAVSGYLGGLGAMALGKHPTLDAAKAAAQADYEARILAALEPVAAPDPAAIREAALKEAEKALRDWQDDLNANRFSETAITVGMTADVVLDLIQKGAADERA